MILITKVIHEKLVLLYKCTLIILIDWNLFTTEFNIFFLCAYRNSISFDETYNILNNTRWNENHHISSVEIYYVRLFNWVCYHFPPSLSTAFRFLNTTKICNFAGFSHFRCSYCETLYYIIFHGVKQTDTVLMLTLFFFLPRYKKCEAVWLYAKDWRRWIRCLNIARE